MASPYQPFHQSPPAYGAAYVIPPTPVVVVVRDGRSRDRTNSRFFRALFWGIVIWVLLAGLIDRYLEVISWYHRHRHRHHHPWAVQLSEPWEYQIPSDVGLDNCTPPDAWRNVRRRDMYKNTWSAETIFELSPIPDALYFLARGDMSGGSSKVLVDPSLSGEQARVNVTVHYTDQSLRDLAKVCEISREEGEGGVGIFTPHYGDGRPHESFMWFQTTVHLPGSRESEYLINNFETDLPNTVHDLKDLSQYFFENVQLEGSNAPINVDALRMHKASIKGSNSPISGSFNVTHSLALDSSNGVVQVDVGVTASRSTSPRVVISTSNSPLSADISLFSDGDAAAEYDITTSSSNSPLLVKFSAQPADSILRFTGSTTNSPAQAKMHPSFEGNFDLHSTLFKPSVKFDSQLEDPSGRGRKRSVSISSSWRDVSGKVVWENPHDLKGHATLSTTYSPVTLEL